MVLTENDQSSAPTYLINVYENYFNQERNNNNEYQLKLLWILFKRAGEDVFEVHRGDLHTQGAVAGDRDTSRLLTHDYTDGIRHLAHT